MARKLKFREPTDVVSVRLPVSLIERLDGLCHTLRIGRAEFLVAVLKRYPEALSPERARVWLANLAWLFIGGGAALLAALHSGGVLGDRLSPARTLHRPPVYEEAQSPFAPGRAPAPPPMPPSDIRAERAWRPGDLQGLIPRHRAAPRPLPPKAPGHQADGADAHQGSTP